MKEMMIASKEFLALANLITLFLCNSS
uniref:Uncharacterized protein n=1 Tax=Tetranychus urticae TaxID=32264 RepID=T1JQV4_TETUR